MVWSTRLAITTAAVLLCVTCAVWSKPHIPLDVVDTCIFTCDYCYKGDLLLRCANECLETEGKVPKLWRATCPYFGKPLYFEK